MLAFKTPPVSLDEQLDDLIAMVRRWKSDDYAWPALDDIAWLRSILTQFWSPDYPQPYIGTGPEDAMICLYWKTVEWTFTLEIETGDKIGYLCRAPNQAIGEVELAEDMDLTGGEAWQQIASELGVAIDRNGKVLAPSMGHSVPERGNTGYGIPAQNKPATTRTISGRPRFRRRSKSRRPARYARGATFKSGITASRRVYSLHRSRTGSGRRYSGVRARAA